MNIQTQDLEFKARSALDMVTRHGVNGAPVDRTALQYGLEHGLFKQADVDTAQKRYEASHIFMSIESRLYNMFYDGFERLDSKVIELTESGRNEEIPDLERPLKKADKLFTAIKYAAGAFALYQGADVLHDVIVNNGADQAIYLKSALAAASGFLSVHFHYATKIGKTLKEKIFRRNTSEEKSKINRWRKIGRYSHFGGILSVGAGVAPIFYEFATNFPIIGGALMGVVGYGVYHNWIQGYNALYKAEADFINGERRFKPEPTPSK